MSDAVASSRESAVEAARFLESDASPVLESTVRAGDEDFAEHMRALVVEWRERLAEVRAGGGAAQVERHRGRGKLTARERIERPARPRHRVP